MGSYLLGNFFSSGKLYHCKVTISYSKYTWIEKQTNLLFNFLYPIWYWCRCIHVSSYSNGGSLKQRIMGPEVKQITLWTQSSKFKYFWSSKNWSRKESLPSINSLPLWFIHRRLSYFKLCWQFCNSLTQTRDNHIINWITK